MKLDANTFHDSKISIRLVEELNYLDNKYLTRKVGRTIHNFHKLMKSLDIHAWETREYLRRLALADAQMNISANYTGFIKSALLNVISTIHKQHCNKRKFKKKKIKATNAR